MGIQQNKMMDFMNYVFIFRHFQFGGLSIMWLTFFFKQNKVKKQLFICEMMPISNGEGFNDTEMDWIVFSGETKMFCHNMNDFIIFKNIWFYLVSFLFIALISPSQHWARRFPFFVCFCSSSHLKSVNRKRLTIAFVPEAAPGLRRAVWFRITRKSLFLKHDVRRHNCDPHMTSARGKTDGCTSNHFLNL